MAKYFVIIILLILLFLIFWNLQKNTAPRNRLDLLSSRYIDQGPREVGSANLVTAVVVAYRGFDTLGEVIVLFLAATGVGFLMQKRQKAYPKSNPASEILRTGSDVLLPVIILTGTYIFLHGHLTPGGGFQGGVVIASGFLLQFLARPESRIKVRKLHFIESISGFFYVLSGLAGLILAGGFLDSRFLPLGKWGELISAGAIPLIYSFIGLKVGSELVGILNNLKGD
ncbi:MAG: Na(+)/H(+) antiporter subunit B [Candidatus Cloacimonetes bacterium]|nr:Na(+)/H(+) antiporter subunit B [Candidatus Cloacimonadota bacterium]